MSDDVLDVSRIRLGGTARDRDGAIAEVGAMLVDAGAVTPAYVEAMNAREATVSTYMGNLLAIPHGTNEAKDEIVRSAIAIVRYDDRLDWGGEPVRFVVGIAGRGDEHLGILSGLALVFSDESQVERMLAAGSPDEIADILADVNDAA